MNIAFTPPYYFLLFLIFISCEEELTPNQIAEKKLISASWDIQNVKIDGISSNLYKGLQLQFTKSGFTTRNGGDIFGSSGTWSFSGDYGKLIEFGNGLTVQIVNLTPSVLTLSFNWDKTIFNKSGRSASLRGEHEMTFAGK